MKGWKQAIGMGGLIVFMGLCLTGIARGAGKEELTVGLGLEPMTMDPHRAADLATALVQRQVYNYLFGYDQKMNLVPELAESYKLSPDKKTWTLFLRRGIKFHNGEDFNASSVKFTIERILDPATKSARAGLFRMIKSIKVVDDYTVALTTDQPYLPMLSQLTYYPLGMLNPKAVRDHGINYGLHPVGTGPFKFVEWIPGARIVLERNDGYWEAPKPKLKRIVFRFVREDFSRTMLLESGEADFILQVPPREAQRLKTNKEMEIVLVDTHYTAYLYLVNNQEPPFDNIKVRKALNHAINKKAIVESVLLGNATVYSSPLSPVGWGHHKTGAYEYDPEKARKLLAEAGYGPKNKLKTELWSPVGRFTLDTEVTQAIQGQLMDVGIEVDLQKKIDYSALLFAISKGRNRIGFTQYGPVTGDADQGLWMYHSKADPSANKVKYANPRVDALLEKARMTEEPKTRLEAYARAQELILEDAPNVWLYYPRTIYGQKRNVKGVIFVPLEHVLFKNAYKE